MGALHEGHFALVRQARAECERVAVSIFVNPIQFNNPDDLARYPARLNGDSSLLQAEGVDLVMAPEPEEFISPGIRRIFQSKKLQDHWKAHQGLATSGG